MTHRRISTLAALLLATAGLAACAHDLPPAAGPTLAEAAPCAELGMADEAGVAGPGYGCATLANLRAMVADARDLEIGVEASPPRGDAAFAAAARHRAGKPKPLPADTGTSGDGSTSNSGGGQ